MGDVIDRLIVDCVKGLGATALSITHDMASARRISDRVAMLYKGKIIWVGATVAIDSSGNPYVDHFIHGRADGPLQMQVRDLLGAAAFPVLTIRCFPLTRPFTPMRVGEGKSVCVRVGLGV